MLLVVMRDLRSWRKPVPFADDPQETIVPVVRLAKCRFDGVRIWGHSGLDLLTLSSSHFDPERKWVLSQAIEVVIGARTDLARR
jgi:hypothetical protein